MRYTTTHTEYINQYGKEVPSVTTILKILNKPALVKWANYLGFKRENVDDILEKSSIIGTNVHTMIYSYLMEKYFIFISSRMCGKHLMMNYMNSFITWKNTHTIKPIFMEKKLTTDDFGGTVDFYGIVDDKKTILDFKTSKRAYSSMFLQLAAYCIMIEAMNYEVDQVAIINIKETGYDEKFILREQLEPYINVFKKLVSLFHDWFDLNEQEGWGSILG